MGIRKLIRPAIFLDRDGVLNPTILNPATGRMEAPLHPHDLRLIDGVIPALQSLQKAAFPLILVSNQPNYALGKLSYETHRTISHKLEAELAQAGIHFTRFSYCLHHPNGRTPGYSGPCSCRKPSPGMLLQARDDFGLTLAKSWMVGDQPTDTQCGHAAGARTIRIAPEVSGPGRPVQVTDPCADYVARDLAEAAQIILGDARL
ncbi:MAG TPA: HAD-IIIA family hydrolase [Acidobacteriaceae bacterium]|jgi:D-glycero-D-manno-heptose 1,7-bisphosphate phosphatase|nr:HAD-IIIA family hydrolase [Acidobacteriaceae bacterium]